VEILINSGPQSCVLWAEQKLKGVKFTANHVAPQKVSKIWVL